MIKGAIRHNYSLNHSLADRIDFFKTPQRRAFSCCTFRRFRGLHLQFTHQIMGKQTSQQVGLIAAFTSYWNAILVAMGFEFGKIPS